MDNNNPTPNQAPNLPQQQMNNKNMKPCKACGTLIAKKAKVCPNCGAKNKNHKALIIILIVLGVIILIAAIGSGGDSSPKSATETDEIVTDSLLADSETTATKETQKKQTASLGELNALGSAKHYLDFSSFSEKGLREQLEFEGYAEGEIDYAIKNCHANWKEECAEKAQSYLDYNSFSKEGLRGQLEFEGFTAEQIDYALKAVGY